MRFLRLLLFFAHLFLYLHYMAERICIYAKDVQTITGKGIRYSQKLLKTIKLKLKKKPHQVVSISDFCLYMGLEEKNVTKQLKD